MVDLKNPLSRISSEKDRISKEYRINHYKWSTKSY